MELASDEIPSPMGTIVTAVSEQGLCTLDFDDCAERMHGLLRSRFGTGVRLVRRTDPAGTSTVIRAYLGGDLTALDSITVDVGGTPFQERVWNQLRRIRCGETISYSELAAKIGKPSAVRAVGTANGRNPVALVIPCHRVVRVGGNLGGYAGGLHRKRWLLEHESALAGR